MSWLLVVVAAVFAGFMIWGYKKGFLRVAYSLVAWLICILLVSWASPHVSNWVVENTEVDQKVESRIEDLLRDKVESQDTEIQLPDAIADLIIGDKEAVTGGMILDQWLEQNDGYQVAAQKLTRLLINGVCFLVVLIIVKILLFIIEKVLGFIHELPLIGDADALLGVIAGAVKALILVWFVMALVAFFASTEKGAVVVNWISESTPVLWLYENNLILKLILAFF